MVPKAKETITGKKLYAVDRIYVASSLSWSNEQKADQLQNVYRAAIRTYFPIWLRFLKF
jgi:hypothetical protein